MLAFELWYASAVRWLTVFVLVLAACRGEKPKARDAAAVAVADAAVAPVAAPDLSFVRGEVYVAEERDGVVVTRTLDGRVIDGGGASVFPSASRWKGGLLVIAAEGESEAEHVEQLAVARGGAIERFGPKTQMVRNPVVMGAVLVVESNQHGFREIYRMDEERAVRLTENREGNFEPALSPDGTTIVFTSSRDGDAEVYRMPVAGGRATRLTAFHRDDWSPVWSPDGGMVVFLSDREGRPRLFAMKPDGTEQRRVTGETDPDVVEDLPRFSPDGKMLAYTRGRDVNVVEVASGKVRALTPAGVSDRDMAWSPDGAYLAVIRLAADGVAMLTFVRVSDGSVVATDGRVTPMLVRWLP